MRCEVLPLSSFGSIEPDWARLAATYRQAPFLEVDFVRSLIESFATGAEHLVRVSSDAGLIALGIFSRRRGMWETFQPSQIPIGCFVAVPGADWATLLAVIGRAMPGPTLGVAASQQDPLSNPRPAQAANLKVLDYIPTASIDVVGSFDDYWNARGKNLRQNLRKQRRKLADEGVQLTLETITAAADVAQAVVDYGTLESAGWKASGGTAISADNEQGRFYRRVLERYCARGRGKIYRYRFADKVVVVDLCIESEDTLVILKTTFDESIRAFSPSALMREEAFRHLWEAGKIRRIEFFGRVMEWHTRWTEDARVLYHVNWYRWPTLMRASTALSQRLRPKPSKSEATDHEAV